MVVCIQDSEKKVNTLLDTLDDQGQLVHIADQPFVYTFHEKESNYSINIDYRLIIVRKLVD